MTRPGWNPTRRNRNIGTAKAGRGLANRMVIPESWREHRPFWETLRDPVTVELDGVTVVVEPCRPGFVHAVTVHDVIRMLGLLPQEDIAGLRTVVLRQPTRKQRLLSSVWGRLIYCAEFGRTPGPAIILEAQPVDGCIERPRSLSPDEAEELERLRADGHVVSGERNWQIRTSVASTRATQLYRTLPHEVGHHVQYRREVSLAAGDDFDREHELWKRYFARPEREREDFAHRYARETVERLSAAGEVPFARRTDEADLARWRLDPTWFGLA